MAQDLPKNYFKNQVVGEQIIVWISSKPSYIFHLHVLVCSSEYQTYLLERL